MANDWVLGLASGHVFEEATCAGLRRALDEGDDDAAADVIAVAVAALESANSRYFRFDVENAVGADEPRLVALAAGEPSAAAGIGLTPAESTRKLVALVVLGVDGDDVTVALSGTDKRVSPAVGDVLMFPAYCIAEVESPGGGSIEVAAFHAYGRAFR